MKPFADDTMVAMDTPMLDYHRKNPGNIAMPYFGVCGGFFHRLAAGKEDEVKDSPYYTPKNLEAWSKIKELCGKYHATITQILLGFFMAQDFNMIPLVGPSNVDQLTDAMGTFNHSFNMSDFVL
jgi:aryl-alcohol dehydrogenase-like predicted oxidoreductase